MEMQETQNSKSGKWTKLKDSLQYQNFIQNSNQNSAVVVQGQTYSVSIEKNWVLK